MFRLNKIVFLIFLLASFVCNAVPKDLDFIYQQIIDNHPGIYNALDPEFRKKLEKEYSKASVLLNDSTIDQIQQRVIIESFLQSFDDSHLWVSWNDNSGLKNKKDNSNRTVDNFGICNINPYIAWVRVPSFLINEKQQRHFKSTLVNLPKARNKSVIVFDLRNNQGGNSEYGSQIVDTLFEKTCADNRRQQMRAKTFVDWRVSSGNIEQSYCQMLCIEKIRQHIFSQSNCHC